MSDDPDEKHDLPGRLRVAMSALWHVMQYFEQRPLETEDEPEKKKILRALVEVIQAAASIGERRGLPAGDPCADQDVYRWCVAFTVALQQSNSLLEQRYLEGAKLVWRDLLDRNPPKFILHETHVELQRIMEKLGEKR
ncbi:MAG: hypothetical protein AAFZ38_07260 [Myxococcota bacterium]